MDLIEQLKAKQKQGEMSQARFAATLRISEAALSLVYAGERQIGESMCRRIVKAYPDLQWTVMGYLMTKPDCEKVS